MKRCPAVWYLATVGTFPVQRQSYANSPLSRVEARDVEGVEGVGQAPMYLFGVRG